jgi:glycosyltransferase involved in cell wall biosynthesis
MNLLMLSNDEALLDDQSRAAARHRSYAERLGELHVVLACREEPLGEIRGRLTIHPAVGKLRSVRWLRMLFAGALLCAVDRPDMISVQDPEYLGLIGLLLSTTFRLPLHVQVHTDVMNPRYLGSPIRTRLRRRLVRSTLNHASRIRTVSQRSARSIQSKLGIEADDLQVLPIYTDVQEFKAGEPVEAIERRLKPYSVRMVSVGRSDDHEKGQSALIDAFADVLEVIPDAGLMLVGAGPDRARYERMAGSLGMSGRILFEDWRSDLPSVLKSFDIYVQVSNYEGWGRTYVEAAAAGLPLIVTDVGLVGEIFVPGEDVLVVPIGDRDALASAMIGLALDPDRRAALSLAGMRALRRLPHITWDDYCRDYVEGLQSCIGEQAGNGGQDLSPVPVDRNPHVDRMT